MANWQSTPSPLALPDELRIPIDAISNVLSLLIALLNVALAILSVIRAFAFGILDPLTAILNALINALEGLLNDFRQIGVFIHGDWYLVEFPPERLRGGFRAYQQRMTARLLDTSDPNRPNFSPATAGVAVFFYSSAPVEQIGRLIQFIVGIARLFNQEPRGSILPTVTNVTVGYGFENFSFYSLEPSEAADPDTVEDLGIADVVNLRWEISAPHRLNPRRPAVIPPAKGFLIELSTVQDGLLLAWSRPARDNTQDGEGSQNRISGFHTDLQGNPIRIYGGEDQFVLKGSAGWNNTFDSSGVRTGARQTYALVNPSDTTPIPLELLKDGDDYLLQRTFYVPARRGSRLLLNQKFGARILKQDMPYEADFEVQSNGEVRVVPGSKRQAETAWARVVAVSNEVDSARDWRYKIAPVVSDFNVTLGVEGGLSKDDRGIPSQAIQISFPDETTSKYMLAIETALAVLLLSRSDLPTDQRGRNAPKVSSGTGLELAAETFSNQVAGTFGPNRYFKRKSQAENFRRNFRRRIRDASNSIYRNSGRLPQSFKEQVVAFVEEDLLDWKWSDSEALDASDTRLVPDATILQSLDSPFQEKTQGVCRNVNSIGTWSNTEDEQTNRQIRRRAASRGFGTNQAIERSDFVDTELLDNIPIMFGANDDLDPFTSALSTGKIWTCRELFDEGVYEAAEYVLRVAGAPGEPVEGGWIALRLIPQGIPQLERIFSEVIEWAESFKQGLKGLVAAILEYINFLEARIVELQELLLRLQSYLDFADGIFIPAGSYLIVTGEGTEGLLNGFLAAGNEPQDGPLDYGAGAVLVAGGLPDIVFSLIKSLLPP